jgi:hypothetical protein
VSPRPDHYPSPAERAAGVTARPDDPHPYAAADDGPTVAANEAGDVVGCLLLIAVLLGLLLLGVYAHAPRDWRVGALGALLIFGSLAGARLFDVWEARRRQASP